MKIIKIKPAPCNCTAYAFPHRIDGGTCFGKEPDSCSDCEFSSMESDPYGTGDNWYEVANCENKDGCPWNKE